MNISGFACLSGAIVGLASCNSKSAKKDSSDSLKNEPKPVNVIYLITDDLGYGDIGCYGQKYIKTPNLDKMAAEGMLFTQHYAGCTVSAPSRCSLMTGLHTGHTQVRGNKEIKPEGQMAMKEGTFTLGKMFQSRGYVTGVFGKWGLGSPGSTSEPNSAGFNEFYGYNCQRESHSYYPDHLWHNQEKILFPENENFGRKTYSHDLIHQQALGFIHANKDKPFFAMLTYTLPHAEVNVPHDDIYKEYEAMFGEPSREVKPNGGYYPSEKPHASFAAMVARIDKYVGEIMAELKKDGLDKNTIFIFTSDNGPHEEGGADPAFFGSSGPLKGLKRDLYEGGIRVPFIAWAPNYVPAGTKSDFACAFWDMMPTFAELIDAEIPVATDGVSFLSTLTQKGEQKFHDYLYWEFHELGGRQALRSGNWKLIRLNVAKGDSSKYELYNIKNDIHEDNNLSTENPEKLEELKQLLNGARTESEIFNFGKK